MRMQYFINRKGINFLNVFLIIFTSLILIFFFQLNIENIYFDTSDNLRRFEAKEAFYYKLFDFDSYQEFFLYQLYLYLMIFLFVSVVFKSFILLIVFLLFFFKDIFVYIHLFDQIIASYFLIFSLLKLNIKNQLLSFIVIIFFHFQSIFFYFFNKMYQLLFINLKNNLLILFIFLIMLIFVLINSDNFINLKYNSISQKDIKIFDGHSYKLFISILLVFFTYFIFQIILNIDDNYSFSSIFVFFIFITMVATFLNLSDEWYYRVVFWIRYSYSPILIYFILNQLLKNILSKL